MANLSIVIPWTGDEQSFEATLVSVLQNRPADTEVLVAHRGNYDDPYDLSDDVVFIESERNAGLSEMINDGVWESEADLVHVLLCGTSVREGWADEAMARFDDPQVGMVAPIVVSSEGRVVCCGVRYRAGGGRQLVAAGRRAEDCERAKPHGPALLAGFYRREAVLDLDGFAEEVGEHLGDIDLALSLLSAGYRCEVEPTSIVEFGGERQAARGFRFGHRSQRLFLRHAPHVGWGKSLVLHPLHVLGDTLAGLFSGGAIRQLAGRLLGVLEAPRHRRFHRRVGQLRGPEATDRLSGEGECGGDNSSADGRRAA